MRSQPRLEKIKAGEADMIDTLAEVRKQPQFNGHAVAMGFCYGGPYAILGPKRLGYDAGISCHGTQLRDFLKDLDGVTKPVCIIWGDKDHQAPAEVLDAYRGVPARMKNVEVHIFPGVLHGYMMRSNPVAFNRETHDFSMARAQQCSMAARIPKRASGVTSIWLRVCRNSARGNPAIGSTSLEIGARKALIILLIDAGHPALSRKCEFIWI